LITKRVFHGGSTIKLKLTSKNFPYNREFLEVR